MIYIECRGCFDVHEDDIVAGGPSSNDFAHLGLEQQNQQKPMTSAAYQDPVRAGAGNSYRSAELKRISSTSVLQENSLSAKKFNGDGDR